MRASRSTPEIAHAFHALTEARMHEAAFEIRHTETQPWLQASTHALPKIWAQGDILLERLARAKTADNIPDATCITVGHGASSGHRHTVCGHVRFTRDAALADDVPSELYLGHLVVAGPAILKHEQHDPIVLQSGTYRVRRQRRLQPAGASTATD